MTKSPTDQVGPGSATRADSQPRGEQSPPDRRPSDDVVIGGAWSPGEVVRPFFTAPPSTVPVTRRMLLVFLGFAPSAAVGPQRWKRLGQLAAERGWQIDVVTQHPDYLAPGDPSRLRDLAPGMRLFGFRARPSALQRANLRAWALVRPIFGRLLEGEQRDAGERSRAVASRNGSGRTASATLKPLRAYATIVDWFDARRVAKAAAELGVALAAVNRYDVVVSSGPSHAAHDGARLIAESAGLPLVIDLRDAWVHKRLVVPRELDPSTWRRLNGPVERRCLAAARLVVLTTDPLRDALADGYPALADRFVTVRNGADRETLPRSHHGKRFVIAYAGNLYAGRDPRLLFRAARRVIAEQSLTPADFAIQFLGGDVIEGQSLSDIAEEEGIAGFFASLPPRPHAEALEFLSQAAMLVSLPQHDTFAIPAKVFEYTQFNAWLLALAEPHSATAMLLRGSGADVVPPDDVDGITRAIARRHREFQAGTRPLALNTGGQFDRRIQAERLFAALDECLAVS